MRALAETGCGVCPFKKGDGPMYGSIRPKRARYAKKAFRPWLPGSGPALEMRFLPGNMLFYSDPNYAYGTMNADSTSEVQPIDPSQPYSVEDMESGTTGTSAQTTLTNVVIGTLATEDSSGEVPEEDHVSVTEVGNLLAAFAEPGPDPSTSNTEAIQLDVFHSSTDTVTADDSGSYIVGSGGVIFETTDFSTGNAYNFNIQNPTGGPPNGTITIAFDMYMKDPLPGFAQQASLSLQSSHLDVSLNTAGTWTITDPSTIDPSTGEATVLASGAGLNSGDYITFQETVPAFTHESISATSMYGTWPDGVNVSSFGSVTYNGQFYYNLTETIS